MLIRIDPSSEEPVFSQLASAIRSQIASGALTAGHKLPSAKEVAESLDINLHTVLRAYQELRDEGLVDVRRGRGAVVTQAAAATFALLADVNALVLKAHRLGLTRATVAGLVRDANPEGADLA